MRPCPTDIGEACGETEGGPAQHTADPAETLRDLVDQQRDMAVVGEVRTLGELPAAVAALQGEVVILTFSPSRDAYSPASSVAVGVDR